MSDGRTIGDFFKLQGGYAYKSRDFTDEGVPVVKIGNVTGGGAVDLSSTQFIPEEIAEKTSDFLSEDGDVLIAMTGANVGKVARVQRGAVQFAINQRVGRFQPKKSQELSKDFLYFLVSSEQSYLFFKNAAYGSAQPNISGKLIESLEFPNLTVEQANGIGSALKTLDDKIALNRKLNETLEGMARALFQSWFVDFDPVKAKLAAVRHGRDPERACMAALSGKLRIAPGKPKPDSLDDQLPTDEEIDAAIGEIDSLSPSQQENLAQTATHSPAAFQESELGLIPEGWEVVSLESLTQIITKGTTPKKADVANATDPALVNFIKVKDITAGGEINRDSLESIAQSIHTGPLKRSILKTDDLLYSIAGTIGRITIVDKDLDNSNCNQAIGFIRLKSPQQFLSLCLETLHSERVKEFISSQVVQAVQANASLTNLRQILIVVPNEETLDRWNTLANPCLIQRRELASQSRTLAELRDTLMPKLLSGELSVGDASDTVEAVVES